MTNSNWLTLRLSHYTEQDPVQWFVKAQETGVNHHQYATEVIEMSICIFIYLLTVWVIVQN